MREVVQNRRIQSEANRGPKHSQGIAGNSVMPLNAPSMRPHNPDVTYRMVKRLLRPPIRSPKREGGGDELVRSLAR